MIYTLQSCTCVCSWVIIIMIIVYLTSVVTGGLWTRSLSTTKVGPTLYKGDFTINGKPKDTFIDMTVIISNIMSSWYISLSRVGLRVSLLLMLLTLAVIGLWDHNKHCMCQDHFLRKE